MKANVDDTALANFVQELRLEAAKCPTCEGTRETVFTARGRDNIVNCLECENIHQALEYLDKALALLRQG